MRKKAGFMMSKLEEEFNIQMKALCRHKYEREYTFAKPRRYRFDFAIVDLKVGVEVEGGTWSKSRHTTGSGFQKDCEKYNLAAINGWVVIRGDSQMVKDGRLIDWVNEACKTAYKRIPF